MKALNHNTVAHYCRNSQPQKSLFEYDGLIYGRQVGWLLMHPGMPMCLGK